MPRGERPACDRWMHIAKLKKKKDKFKPGLGGLQEGLRYGPHQLLDHSYNGNGRVR